MKKLHVHSLRNAVKAIMQLYLSSYWLLPGKYFLGCALLYAIPIIYHPGLQLVNLIFRKFSFKNVCRLVFDYLVKSALNLTTRLGTY